MTAVNKKNPLSKKTFKEEKLEEEILRLMKLNQKRRYVVFYTSAAIMVIWGGFAILQSEVLNLKAEKTLYSGKVLETAALIFCVVSLACAIALINTRSKQKRKEKELQKLKGEVADKAQEKNDAVEKNAIYWDTIASFMVVTTELAVVLGMWKVIPDVNKLLGLENSAMNFQGISDTIANVICFGVALTFLYLAINAQKSNKGTDKASLIEEEKGNPNKKVIAAASLIAIGGFLMLARKVLLSLEVTNTISYTGNLGKGFNMDTLPLGLIFGIVGMAVFLAGYSFTMKIADKAIKDRETYLSGAQVDLPCKVPGGSEATPAI